MTGVPSMPRASHTSVAMRASPAKKPLTPRLAGPPLPKGEGEKSKPQPSPRSEGTQRWRAGEGAHSTLLDFGGALTQRRLVLTRFANRAILL